MKIAQKLEYDDNINAALFSLGNLARSQQNYDKAIAFYRDSTATSTANIQAIEALLNQITIHRETQNWSAIPPLLEQIQPLIADLAITHDAIYTRINYAQNLIELQKENFSANSRMRQADKAISRPSSDDESLANLALHQSSQTDAENSSQTSPTIRRSP